MKRSVRQIVGLVTCAVFLTGCVSALKEQVKPDKVVGSESTQTKKPSNEGKPQPPKVVPKLVKTVPEPSVLKPKANPNKKPTTAKIEKKPQVVVQVTNPVPQQMAKSKVDEEREFFRRGPGVWRVFAKMDDKERRDLMMLQRTDPKKYRSVMNQKIDDCYAEEVALQKELHSLVEQYNVVTDVKKRTEIKQRIYVLVTSNFQRRLTENRMQLDEMKRRATALEKELNNRSKHADAIVKKQVGIMLSEEEPPPKPPAKKRFMLFHH